MSERSGFRDLIFNLWHRLIPHLKMIDLDFIQCCKHCSKPILACELTRQSSYKPTKILRELAVATGIQAVLINYFPRTPDKAYDKIHRQYLEHIYRLESEIRRKSKERLRAIAEMYQYCWQNHGERQAYDAMIGLVGYEKVYPERSEYQVLDSTYSIKLAMEGYRYCSRECEQADDSRPIPMPEILIPKLTLHNPNENCDDNDLQLSFLD